jgi:DNA-binding transcriptional LysR family regulator
MDMHQLEHFLAIVDEGTFTRAAEKVCRTQPAVSQSIKRLEEMLNTALFARDTPEPTLTEAGKRLLDYARQIVRLRDEAVSALGALRNLSVGMLSIASHETAALYLLPGPLGQYSLQFPDVKVCVYRSPLDEIPRRVLDREVDLGFVAEEPTSRELRSLHIASDELVLIASPCHPLAAQPHAVVEDLGHERFVVHHQCRSSVEKILKIFELKHTSFKVAAELWSFENVKEFVKQGIGLAFVPRVTALQELRTHRLFEVPLDSVRIPRKTFVIFRDQRYMSDAARGLLDILKAFDWRQWHAQKGIEPAATASPVRLVKLKAVHGAQHALRGG